MKTRQKRGKIPRGRQGSLFAKGTVRRKRRGRVTFVDRSPEEIYISDQPLRAVLEGQGERGVLRLRRFLREQDWSGFEAKYDGGGRPVYHPAVVMGLVLWGMLQGVDSLRGLERLAQQNIACWWLTGGEWPDHSQLGRFLQRHREVLSEGFFEEMTRQVLRSMGGGGTRLAGDATVMQAASSAYRRIREEAAREAWEQAQDEQEKEKARRVVQELEEREEKKRRHRHAQSKNRAAVSPCEPEAVIQPIKGSRAVPAYKSSVLSNEKQLIVATRVEPSSEADAIGRMLDQSRRVSAEKARELLLDGNYFNGTVLGACQQREVQVWCPPKVSTGSPRYPQERFHYEGARDAYRCPQGKWLHRLGRGHKRGQGMVRYGGAACGACPVRSQCTSSPRGRQIIRYDDEAFRQSVRVRMRSEEGQRYYRQRKAWVEPVFAALKTRQRFRRFRRRGLAQVRLEWALQATAYNLGRWLSRAPGFDLGAWNPLTGLFRRLSARLRPSTPLLGFKSA